MAPARTAEDQLARWAADQPARDCFCSLFGERHDADAGVAQSNRRIQALVTVICLALLIFCLVEREVRRAIAPPSSSRTSTSASQPSPPGG